MVMMVMVMVLMVMIIDAYINADQNDDDRGEVVDDYEPSQLAVCADVA